MFLNRSLASDTCRQTSHTMKKANCAPDSGSKSNVSPVSHISTAHCCSQCVASTDSSNASGEMKLILAILLSSLSVTALAQGDAVRSNQSAHLVA